MLSKIHKALPVIYVTLVAVLGFFFLLPAPAAFAAAPDTKDVASTIKDKCQVALPNAQTKHKDNNDVQALEQLCSGTGIYKANATSEAQRAKRLLDLCITTKAR
jgi:hypothetical protein